MKKLKHRQVLETEKTDLKWDNCQKREINVQKKKHFQLAFLKFERDKC